MISNAKKEVVLTFTSSTLTFASCIMEIIFQKNFKTQFLKIFRNPISVKRFSHHGLHPH